MTPGASPADRPSLLELIEPDRWQRLQDHFASVLGIALRTISPSRDLLVNPSWPPGLSSETLVKLLRIGEELETLFHSGAAPDGQATVTVPLGVTYSVVPIRADGQRALAYFVTGPVVVGPRESEVPFRKRAAGLGLDPQAAWALLLSLKLYSFTGIRSVLNLLEEVGSSLAQFAYQARQLSDLLPASGRMDHLMGAYYTDRLLHSLLEAAVMATRADGGSVMVYDGRGEVLKIRASHGLTESIVAETRQRRGEGLAGLATAQRTILLVDQDTPDAGVRNRMARPELISSLVAPLVPEQQQEPIGVLSLRTGDPARRFTQEHVELLRRLLDLTGIALGSLRTA